MAKRKTAKSASKKISATAGKKRVTKAKSPATKKSKKKTNRKTAKKKTSTARKRTQREKATAKKTSSSSQRKASTKIKKAGKKKSATKKAAQKRARVKKSSRKATANATRKSKKQKTAKVTTKKPAVKKGRSTRKTQRTAQSLVAPLMQRIPTGATHWEFPDAVHQEDYLPEWFGGQGLTPCFHRLNVSTIRELSSRSEDEIRKTCGDSAVVRFKAHLEHMHEVSFSTRLERISESRLRPFDENFAYFLKGGAVLPDGSEAAIGVHICEIIKRNDSQHLEVRLGGKLAGQWQDIVVPESSLELVSRDDRQEMLARLHPLQVAHLISGYGLSLHRGNDPCELILDYEFTQFGRQW